MGVHGIMRRAGELQEGHLAEMRRELCARIEEEVRQQLDQKLDKDRGALEEEKQRLRAEVEDEKQALRDREEELAHRFEEEWARMRGEFENKARDMARGDLEPLAKNIVDETEEKEKKAGGKRRCSIM